MITVLEKSEALRRIERDKRKRYPVMEYRVLRELGQMVEFDEIQVGLDEDNKLVFLAREEMVDGSGI